MNSYPSAWGTGFSLAPERENMDSKEATAFFVAVAQRIHRNRFDYSQIVLPGGSIKIAMARPVQICEFDEWGHVIDTFTTIPWSHLLTQDGR